MSSSLKRLSFPFKCSFSGTGFLAFGNRKRKGSFISYLFEPFIIVVQPGRQLSTLVLLSKELYHGQAISSIDFPPGMTFVN